jgi:hypothetical protein
MICATLLVSRGTPEVLAKFRGSPINAVPLHQKSTRGITRPYRLNGNKEKCYLWLARPRSETRLLEPTDRISLMLETFGRDRRLCPRLRSWSSTSRGSVTLSAPATTFSAKGGGFTELDLRVCCRTSSTQASPSGLMEICRERGLGPARPRGVA